jgi:hypothetical protein
MLNQVGGGGFAIGTGDPDQGESLAGLAPKLSRQQPRPAGQGVGCHQHPIPRAGRLGRGRRRADHGRQGPGPKCLGPEAAPIHLGAWQPHKQGAGAYPAGIATDAGKLPVRQVRRHLQTHLPQDRMEQLGHGTS